MKRERKLLNLFGKEPKERYVTLHVQHSWDDRGGVAYEIERTEDGRWAAVLWVQQPDSDLWNYHLLCEGSYEDCRKAIFDDYGDD